MHINRGHPQIRVGTPRLGVEIVGPHYCLEIHAYELLDVHAIYGRPIYEVFWTSTRLKLGIHTKCLEVHVY